jgi:hypothetical protein
VFSKCHRKADESIAACVCSQAYRRDAALLLVRQVRVRLLQGGHDRPTCRVPNIHGIDSAVVPLHTGLRMFGMARRQPPTINAWLLA